MTAQPASPPARPSTRLHARPLNSALRTLPPTTDLLSFEMTGWRAISWKWQRWQRRHAAVAAAAVVVVAASRQRGRVRLCRQLRLLLQGPRWLPTRVALTGMRSPGFLQTPCTTLGCARSTPGRAAHSAQRLRYVHKRDNIRQASRQADKQNRKTEEAVKVTTEQTYFHQRGDGTSCLLALELSLPIGIICLLFSLCMHSQ